MIKSIQVEDPRFSGSSLFLPLAVVLSLWKSIGIASGKVITFRSKAWVLQTKRSFVMLKGIMTYFELICIFSLSWSKFAMISAVQRTFEFVRVRNRPVRYFTLWWT